MNPQMNRISTGIKSLDGLLDGGFQVGEINLIYGEATTGKTTLCLTTVFHHLSHNRPSKAVFLDIDNKLNVSRLKQISSHKGDDLLLRIQLFTPESFNRQSDALEYLPELIKGDLLVVDSITGLYRGETENAEATFRANKELNRQLGYLSEIAKTSGSTILLTGQVRSVLDTKQIEPVAQRLLRYWSSIIICLEKGTAPGTKLAILEKPEEFKSPILLTVNKSGMTEAYNEYS
jgi:RecA/RadA recombinase